MPPSFNFTRDGHHSNSPLSMEDAIEGGPSPILPRQGEDGPQVVEGDVAFWEGTLQPGFLEGGPFLLQGPGTTQVALKEAISVQHFSQLLFSNMYFSFVGI